jgi:hypothetical protein
LWGVVLGEIGRYTEFALSRNANDEVRVHIEAPSPDNALYWESRHFTRGLSSSLRSVTFKHSVRE